MFRLANGEPLDIITLNNFLMKHNKIVRKRYQPLMEAYRTEYPIFKLPPKPDYKPDKRIAVNYAKYITDTMNGFFIGVPIKVTCDSDADISNYVNLLDAYNDQDDNNAELSKLCSIYGKGYEMYYVDDRGNIGITYLSPEEAFMIYDDSILERPRYFVRRYTDSDDIMHVSVSDNRTVRYATDKGGLHWDDANERIHGFDGVPATEYRENAEEIGIFEPVMSMIDEYNEAISEKANDVAYFADAYLKILGAKVEEENLRQVRSNQIINFPGNLGGELEVDFLKKPSGDESQEHLLDRLEKLIFQISMVANISDENFGTSSGIALKYKLQAMSNLALTKQRKFTSGMNRRYMLIFSNPISGMKNDDWMKLKYTFTQNIPANLLEETQIAGNLEGIVSQKTQLSVLSCVENVTEEISQIDKESRDLMNRMDVYGQQSILENAGAGEPSEK